METLVTTLDFLFGCHHTHLSRVFTIDRRTYRVCCDCGAKFKYSLAGMCSEGRFTTSLTENGEYQPHSSKLRVDTSLLGQSEV
jgi:hypothetical protein